MPLPEPRAYRFARYLGRAVGHSDLIAIIGAFWIVLGVWLIRHEAGMIVLGAFFLLAALMTAVHEIRSRGGQR